MFLKTVFDIFSKYTSGLFNECIDQGEFPSISKNANITRVFKKDFTGSIENYHLFSILPVISKIFEKLLAHQITS